MSWTKEMFGVEKPVIALLHLNAFPGDPRFVSTGKIRWKKQWRTPEKTCMLSRTEAWTAC